MHWDFIFKVIGITVWVIVFSTAIALFFYYLIVQMKLVHRAKKGDVAAQQLLAKLEAERAAAPQSTDDDEYCISNKHNLCTIRGRMEAFKNDDD